MTPFLSLASSAVSGEPDDEKFLEVGENWVEVDEKYLDVD